MHDPTAAADHLVAKCVEELNADYSSLSIVDSDRQRVRVIAVAGAHARKSLDVAYEYSLESPPTSFTAEGFKAAAPIQRHDVESKAPSFLKSEPVGSLCGVPLKAAGNVLGVLIAARKQGEQRFAEQDAAKLYGLGRQFVIDARLGPECGDTQLELEIEIPEGVSGEAFVHEIETLSLLADDIHRSLGGRGLRVQRLDVLEESLVPEGLPNA